MRAIHYASMTILNETQQDAAREDDGKYLVELEHVEKHYGNLHVLRDINLKVKKGEVLVIVGPSGSGKSTMCRTINRLETIDSGASTASRCRRKARPWRSCAPKWAWSSSPSTSSPTRRSSRT